eukprot:COSAG02_NODE_28447_length_589_cov_1.136735_1_plen_49_part_10
MHDLMQNRTLSERQADCGLQASVQLTYSMQGKQVGGKDERNRYNVLVQR